ncbi:disease resistance protein RGA5-like [Miscanthus floridulus]|uniref:disease resistance protein RGA5-like n=1 Tax=Miscanthus floridulus TaxID=154761 RepID=UPI003457FEFA
MDLVTGALGILPSKLLDLLKEEYKLQQSVRVQVQSLSRELESMHAALRKVAAVPWDQLDEQDKVWARDVREASYDMEDILDTFLIQVDGRPHLQPADRNLVKRPTEKIGQLMFSLSKVKARHDIAGAIEEIKKQLQEVAERRARYRVDDVLAKPAAATSIDPRLSALFTKRSQLVGMNMPKSTLINMLSVSDDDMSNKKMKIVCVVGFGGLGKTTLAKRVFDEFKANFCCAAFVSVGRIPDLKKVFRDILINLGHTDSDMMILDETQLINSVRGFLESKRYFIVIDDIWDEPSWNTIRYALDDNNLGSKIIITTRIHAVAEKVGCSYKMQPLSYESSKQLFYERIFGFGSKCPDRFSEISEKILRKCGGVPLAIITISSLLANKLRNIKVWSELCDSIGSGFESTQDMDNMRKILSLSYIDLPCHLKTCVLYLSIFPEDFDIRKDRLIWRWIAEGFVLYGEGNQSLFEVGESYFNELLNRSLIEPTYMLYGGDGNPVACRVHDVVLDLICFLSREEHFVTTLRGDSMQNSASLRSKVRRLSFHSTTWPKMNMSKLRSLTIFSPGTINSVPSLSSYHLLRVLDLEKCNLRDHPCLRFVSKLFHLRYLSLSKTRYPGVLPVEIGKLQFLQTLNVFGTDIPELPSSIVGLRKLMCLYVDESTWLPEGFSNLTSLEVLGSAYVDSGSIAEELGHLTQLRELWVYLAGAEDGGTDENLGKVLVESLGKLHRIQYLQIKSEEIIELEAGSVELSLGNLRHLYVSRTTSLPKWINPLSLLLLSWLYIKVGQLRQEDIHALGTLPALRILMVKGTGGIQVVERFMVSADAFPCVINCEFSDFASVLPSIFPRGALPRLENFEFCIQLEDFCNGEIIVEDLGIGHLPSLQGITVCFHGQGGYDVARKVEEVLCHQAHVHPNHPSVGFSYCDLVSIGNEEDDDMEETLSDEGAGLSLEWIRL